MDTTRGHGYIKRINKGYGSMTIFTLGPPHGNGYIKVKISIIIQL